jgi:hypothetical protein
MGSFKVDFAILCDYFAHDHQGKYLLAGGYGPVINIGGNPKTWPPMYVVVALRPRLPEFRFAINLLKPDHETMVQVEGHYSTERPPDDVDMVLIGARIPPNVIFPGFGTYSIEILEKFPSPATAFSRQISVRPGSEPASTQPSPKVNLKLHVSG